MGDYSYIEQSKWNPRQHINVSLYTSDDDDIEMLIFISEKLKDCLRHAVAYDDYEKAKKIIKALNEIKDGLAAANDQTDTTTTKDSMEVF